MLFRSRVAVLEDLHDGLPRRVGDLDLVIGRGHPDEAPFAGQGEEEAVGDRIHGAELERDRDGMDLQKQFQVGIELDELPSLFIADRTVVVDGVHVRTAVDGKTAEPEGTERGVFQVLSFPIEVG